MRAEATSKEFTARPCTLSIVSHGQGPLVERLLADLAAFRDAPVCEILITRNLPGDGVRVPAEFPFRVRFIDNETPRGFAANHNAAFARCATPWFAVLNPDLRLPCEPFAALIAQAAPDTALLAPRVLEADGSEADSARGLPTPAALARRVVARKFLSLAATQRGGDTAADWYAGMFLLFRSNAFRTVGGFDEHYFLYCEDVDVCARLRLAGWRMRQVCEVDVVHDARRASRRSLRHVRWHLRSLARLWTSGVYWRYRALLAVERRSGPARGMARS